jgi:exosortase B
MYSGGIPMSPPAPSWLAGARSVLAKVDVIAMAAILIGWATLYVPTFWDLAHSTWAHDEQGHGPIILAVSFWLLFQKRDAIQAAHTAPRPILGMCILLLGLLVYAFGRSQTVLMFEVGSQILVLISLLLIFKGSRALKVAWFPLFFLVFMVPLPGVLVASVTTPLKLAVSSVAESVLYQLGYPVARTGIVLSVGQYQLLIADACAGLNSIFTLEALGLLYLNLMSHTSFARNASLAVLIIPISFSANVIRVMILVLATYLFGDEVGQGFIHRFAGTALFTVALSLTLLADKCLDSFLPLFLKRSTL